MTDEDVIKRRLLIDGDGTGDDRRLNVLLKTFLKWCNSNDSPENNQIMYDRLMAQLAQCEFAVTKSDFATKMMKQELKNYETISDTIETSIEIAKREIESSKEDLILAKQIRKNRMEYDALAKVINSQPDRKKTTEQLDNLKKELNELEERKAQLQRKLETRKNDFLVLMRAIKELQSDLGESSSDDEENEWKMHVDDDDKDIEILYASGSPQYGAKKELYGSTSPLDAWVYPTSSSNPAHTPSRPGYSSDSPGYRPQFSRAYTPVSPGLRPLSEPQSPVFDGDSITIE